MCGTNGSGIVQVIGVVIIIIIIILCIPQYPACHSFLIKCLSDCQIEKDIPTTLESEAGTLYSY